MLGFELTLRVIKLLIEKLKIYQEFTIHTITFFIVGFHVALHFLDDLVESLSLVFTP